MNYTNEREIEKVKKRQTNKCFCSYRTVCFSRVSEGGKKEISCSQSVFFPFIENPSILISFDFLRCTLTQVFLLSCVSAVVQNCCTICLWFVFTFEKESVRKQRNQSYQRTLVQEGNSDLQKKCLLCSIGLALRNIRQHLQRQRLTKENPPTSHRHHTS